MSKAQNILLVVCTCSSKQEAERIAKALLDQKLIACANILPGLESLFHWEGKLCQEHECLMLMKTTQAAYDKLEAIIQDLHSYDVPEIIAIEADKANQSYTDWVISSLTV